MEAKLKLDTVRPDNTVFIRRHGKYEYWGTTAERDAHLAKGRAAAKAARAANPDRIKARVAACFAQGNGAYSCWVAMVQRCTNPNHSKYASYGAKGITVYPPWRKSYQTFVAYVGERPSKGHTIDRIDGSKGYEPSNVRWATAREQSQNRKATVLRDELLPQIDRLHRSGMTQRKIAVIYGVGQQAICKALKRYEFVLAQQTAA